MAVECGIDIFDSSYPLTLSKDTKGSCVHMYNTQPQSFVAQILCPV